MITGAAERDRRRDGAAVQATEGATVVGVDLVESRAGDLAITADVTDEEPVKGMYERAREEFGAHRRAVQQRRHLADDDASVLDTSPTPGSEFRT